MRRFFDIVFSSGVLLIGSPILLGITLAIRMTSKGNAVFKHNRVGQHGKIFSCYKFRTMYPDADQRLKSLLKEDPVLLSEWKKTHKLSNDPRIAGKVGKFLRRTSLDELPQFWNVLKGDLSIVGPRPLTEEEIINRLGQKAPKILSVKPGLTGIWQTAGRGKAVTYQMRIQMDEEYVEKQNFWLDLKLICKTIPCMILSRGL
ncbi:MAG: sugar transferase [Parachlamydiales bacterium]|nr:sugar transferase [Parachlamydiales bacterium]